MTVQELQTAFAEARTEFLAAFDARPSSDGTVYRYESVSNHASDFVSGIWLDDLNRPAEWTDALPES